MSRLPGENLKKSYFFKLLPFEYLDIESLVSQKLLQLGASNLGQLEDKRSYLFFSSNWPLHFTGNCRMQICT